MPFIPFTLASIVILAAMAGCVGTSGPMTASQDMSGRDSGWKWPWEGPAPYRYLGAGHYGQKRLLDVEGEFAEIAVSPSGRQVVFRGREGREAYRLFLSDVDGTVRQLAETGLEPQSLSWSHDEKTLVFLTQETTREGMRPGASPDTPGIPSGKTVQVLTLATGEIRRVVTLPGIGAFYPSPAHDYAMIYGYTGYKGSKADFTLDVVDLKTGDRRPLEANPGQMHTTHAGVWSPSGNRMAAYGSTGRSSQILVLDPPEWKATTVSDKNEWNARLHWSADGQTLFAFEFGPDGDFSRRTLPLGQTEASTSTIPVEPPPADFTYGYELMMPSPDGSRLLAIRRSSSTMPESPDSQVLPPVTLLFSVADRSTREVLPGLTPIAWLDATRLLCHSGADQAKRLQVVTL